MVLLKLLYSYSCEESVDDGTGRRPVHRFEARPHSDPGLALRATQAISKLLNIEASSLMPCECGR